MGIFESGSHVFEQLARLAILGTRNLIYIGIYRFLTFANNLNLNFFTPLNPYSAVSE